MPSLENLNPEFDVDAVLRGQGADPAALRARRPALVQLAEQALQEGRPLIEPCVIYKEFTVQAVRHERLIFEDGGQLTGKLIAQHLAQARKVYVLLCTINTAIEQYASEKWGSSATYSLALDGVGSAAVEALANQACRSLEIMEQEHGWQTTIPFSPGMIDWSVEEGQPQIFHLLEGEKVPVELSPSYIMIPRKSLTMVIGAGPDLSDSGRTCDYCNLRDVCRYQDHYA
ncbi:MAG: hypothetical protein ABSB41_04995 [Anaerolineales bacterium]|jgi:hypothetical protein